MATVRQDLGGLDVLVNNAGICPFHDFLTMPVDLWDRVQSVNLRGAFLCSQAAANAMGEQGRGGRIISVSSLSALVGGAQQTHYTPTKAGVHSLMQSLAIVLGPHGITCNSVMPGAILTDINAEDLADQDKFAYFRRRIPLGRIGEPEDIADPVVFLASAAARYVTGAGLLVDGGMFVNLQCGGPRWTPASRAAARTTGGHDLVASAVLTLQIVGSAQDPRPPVDPHVQSQNRRRFGSAVRCRQVPDGARHRRSAVDADPHEGP